MALIGLEVVEYRVLKEERYESKDAVGIAVTRDIETSGGLSVNFLTGRAIVREMSGGTVTKETAQIVPSLKPVPLTSFVRSIVWDNVRGAVKR